MRVTANRVHDQQCRDKTCCKLVHGDIGDAASNGEVVRRRPAQVRMRLAAVCAINMRHSFWNACRGRSSGLQLTFPATRHNVGGIVSTWSTLEEAICKEASYLWTCGTFTLFNFVHVTAARSNGILPVQPVQETALPCYPSAAELEMT